MDKDWLAVILGGGLFTFLAAVVSGLFLWAKNHADSATSVAQGAKILLEHMMAQREEDRRVIARQQKAIAQIVKDNIAAQEWMEKMYLILREHGIDDAPPPPPLITSLNQVLTILTDEPPVVT